MIFVHFYRADLITGDPINVDFAIVPYGEGHEQHAYCVSAAASRPTAQFYQIFEGPNLKMGRAVSLMHEIPGRNNPPR